MLRRKKSSRIKINDGKAKLLPKISLFFFDRPQFTFVLWAAIAVFGIVSYTTLLNREGFPSISVPFSMVNGAYLVNDPARVDTEVTKPLSNIISKVDNVKTVETHAAGNFYAVVIQYSEGADAKVGNAAVEKAVRSANVLPAQASADFQPLSIGVNERGDDLLLAFYATGAKPDTQELYNQSVKAARFLTTSGGIPLAKSIQAIDPFVRGTDPASGQLEISQKTFDRFGIRVAPDNRFHESIVIGVKGMQGFDVLKLDKQIRAGLDKLNNSAQFASYHAEVSYSPAPDINDQISGLQRSLLDGLVAILIVSALLIAMRASLITVSAMVMVILATLGFIYLIGYSLNTITLFSLILCLSLIVDDTIIMVEAIDAQRRHTKTARETTRLATQKISRAMIAATLTATIGFAPLLFAGGILGSFIKAIPVTVVASLLISLIVALTFIPFLSKFLLLRPKQLGHGEEGDGESAAHHTEALVAKTLSRPLLWANHKRRRIVSLGIVAIIIGFGFIAASGVIFQKKVPFNIFPPTKDGDQLLVQLTFAPNLNIGQTQAIADRADHIVGAQLGENFKSASYYGTGSTQSASLNINLLSFKKRSVTAPQLADKLTYAFKNFRGAQVKVSQQGAGGPADNAFVVRIETDNGQAAYLAAGGISAYMRSAELTRPDGTKAHFKAVTVANPESVSRHNTKKFVQVSAEFDGTDTSALVILAQKAINKQFDDKQMSKYGLKAVNVSFDTGSQDDFNKSFNKMVYAFPILLIAIFVLLATQFKSLLQPLLIFMAIPFSLFGITVGLWITHNSFSFFTMLGFFALLGLSIKNTILLTDYANQARRAGSSPIEAVVISLQERFRPLIATSLTAIVSLIPLYLSNPFWEGLTVTLMFGLFSSTFLVITVFPYYYLGAEYLRLRIGRLAFFKWLVINAVVVGIAVATDAVPAMVFVVLNLLLIIYKIVRRRGKTT